MQETYFKRQIEQISRHAFWSGAAAGMLAGSVLGIMVGLLW